ncbi:uncharacterized protein LOC132041710 [Lycium ferocissimum]|uniref:uncharacterized protein LOC132041710 n=1 Tax=Lycium ferocissimum TaxID=112874 RepID=UPI0028169DFD|nr:uncharacterized protein LOC132041710 [Lycium ferocissimum]
MAAPPNLEEGQLFTRPPRFNGNYYGLWKARMHDFNMAEDSELWDIIFDGPHVPVNKDEAGIAATQKMRQEYNEADRKAVEKNYKVKKILVRGIGAEEYNRILACTTAKEIWEALQTAHERTTQVKNTKIDMLTTEYELFKMKEDESIHDMHTRFTSIINELSSLGEVITSIKLLRKLLRVLHDSWNSKNEVKKERNLVLKAARGDSSDDESEIAYLTWRLHKIIKKNGGFTKTGCSTRNFRGNDNCCHKCGKLGHFMKDCPQNKQDNYDWTVRRNQIPDRTFKKREVTDELVKQELAAKGNSSSESEDENDQGDTSMMAIEDEAIENRLISVLMAKFDTDDEDKERNFLDTKKNLKVYSQKKLISLSSVLIDAYHVLVAEKDELNQNELLEKNLNRVKFDLAKALNWTWSSDMIASMYRSKGDEKEGIGFNREKIPYNPHSKYVSTTENWLCTHCGKPGHYKEGCKARIKVFQRNKDFVKKGVKIGGTGP